MMETRKKNSLILWIPALVIICYTFIVVQRGGLAKLVTSKTQQVKSTKLVFRREHPVIPLPWPYDIIQIKDGEELKGVLKRVDSDTRCKSDLGKSWDSVGEDRDWGLVFVDHAPGERRSADIVRMLPRTKIMVVHDTEQPSYRWPSNWAGRRSFQEIVGNVGTTLLKGDLDEDGILFEKIIEVVNTNNALNKEKKAVAKNLNPDKAPFHAWGTHLHMLMVAASVMVKEGPGDVLEMGAGLFSTAELHNILEKENVGSRMLVSADADFAWLKKLMEKFTCEFHQFLLIPVFSDLAGCKKDGKSPRILEKDANLLGLIFSKKINKSFEEYN